MKIKIQRPTRAEILEVRGMFDASAIESTRKYGEGQLYNLHMRQGLELFCAYDNRELVGGIDTEKVKNSNVVLITEMSVKEEHRRKGIGSALVEYVTKKKHGIIEADVMIEPAVNVRSMEMFKKQGFRPISNYAMNFWEQPVKFAVLRKVV